MTEEKPNKITRSFTVSDMPMDLFARFKHYALEEAGDCYWMAIEKLLVKAEEDWKYSILLKRIEDLENNLPGAKEFSGVETIGGVLK